MYGYRINNAHTFISTVDFLYMLHVHTHVLYTIQAKNGKMCKNLMSDVME